MCHKQGIHRHRLILVSITIIHFSFLHHPLCTIHSLILLLLLSLFSLSLLPPSLLLLPLLSPLPLLVLLVLIHPMLVLIHPMPVLIHPMPVLPTMAMETTAQITHQSPHRVPGIIRLLQDYSLKPVWNCCRGMFFIS